MKPELIFQSSPLYILICVLVGLGYAFLLYQKKTTLTKKQNLILGAGRTVLAGIIAFLLLNPLIKTFNTMIIKPKVVIAVDNSRSMAFPGKKAADDLFSQLTVLVNDLKDKGLDVDIRDFVSEDLNPENFQGQVKFDVRNTNLSHLISEIKTSYEGQNLTDLVLISDGIINKGVSPNFQKYNFKIHTAGFGDSTQHRDVAIEGITANKLAYLGNKFRINADVSSHLFAGKSTTVNIKNSEGAVLARQAISFTSNDDFQTISFELNADKIGKQLYTIEVVPVAGEFSSRNNYREVIIDVVNGKEKILLVAFAPHPDIKAIKSIIEKNDLFDLQIKVLQSDDINTIGTEPFDLLILHQLPDVYGTSNNLVNSLLAKQKPVLFILGSKVNVQSFNMMQEVVSINSPLNRLDKVTGTQDVNFNLFNSSDETRRILDKLPPVLVPFGEYKLFPGAETILLQKVGNIPTGRPLLAVNVNSKRKSGVFSGEGIWQWRMEEYALTDKQEIIDDLITKTLQLISIKDDKRKLRVYPVNESFGIDQKVVLENEAYNALFEKIYDLKINLVLKSNRSQEKVYSYQLTNENSKFEISNLTPGLYSYKASATILGKEETAEGQFLVTESDIESLNSKADFDLLKTLSSQNNGKFVTAKDLATLRNFIDKTNTPDKVISSEELKEMINLKWLLPLLILLVTVEWVLRKYLGTY